MASWQTYKRYESPAESHANGELQRNLTHDLTHDLTHAITQDLAHAITHNGAAPANVLFKTRPKTDPFAHILRRFGGDAWWRT